MYAQAQGPLGPRATGIHVCMHAYQYCIIFEFPVSPITT